jgi:hypothetical protein
MMDYEQEWKSLREWVESEIDYIDDMRIAPNIKRYPFLFDEKRMETLKEILGRMS